MLKSLRFVQVLEEGGVNAQDLRPEGKMAFKGNAVMNLRERRIAAAFVH